MAEPDDLVTAECHTREDGFRKVILKAPAGVLTTEAWARGDDAV